MIPKTYELKNGLKVLIVENHKLPRVSYNLSIDRKPIIEGNKAGVTTLLGSMLGNGTTNISKDDFNEEVDFLGARLSFGFGGGFASSLTKYSTRMPSSKKHKMPSHACIIYTIFYSSNLTHFILEILLLM